MTVTVTLKTAQCNVKLITINITLIFHFVSKVCEVCSYNLLLLLVITLFVYDVECLYAEML